MDDKLDGFCQYNSSVKAFIIHLNSKKVHYPFKYSKDRRLNFTIFHELGHILLDHLEIPRELKSEEDLNLEELEANFFASLILMPDKILFSCNFPSLEATAEYLKVSNSALWYRLNNLKRLDLLRSKVEKTCQCCGNTSFSMLAEYCGICGSPIKGHAKGIHRTFPETILWMAQAGLVSRCHSTSFKEIVVLFVVLTYLITAHNILVLTLACDYVGLGNSGFVNTVEKLHIFIVYKSFKGLEGLKDLYIDIAFIILWILYPFVIFTYFMYPSINVELYI